jgi:hypothetical protein
MTMPEIDKTLVTHLKLAKSKKLFFGFCCKGANGKLIIGKKKPTKEMAAAKKEIGGAVIMGRVSGPLHDMIFEVLKEPPGALTALLKKHVKVHGGLNIVPTFMTKEDAEAEEELEEEGADGGADDADEDEEEAEEDEGESEGGEKEDKEDEEDEEDETKPSDESEEVELDLAAWVTAREHAIKGLKSLAAKVAQTKHATAAGVIKELQSIISKLPAEPASHELEKLEHFLLNDDTLAAAEEVPDEFHNQDIRKPLIEALKSAKKSRERRANA